ncbi:MAG: hypothetical protein ACC618_00530, partial [Patescibacteria group bacterium]
MGPSWRKNYLRYKRLFLTYLGRYKERQDMKMFLEVLLSLFTISIFSIFALRPTLVTIAELIKEIETKKELISQMDAKIQDLGKAQSLYDKEIGRIKLLSTSVPNNPSPDTFIRQIEGLSGKHTVSILASSLGESVLTRKSTLQNATSVEDIVQAASGELSFSVNSTAEYASLYTFLSDLEKTRRPIKFNILTINSSNTIGGKILVFVANGAVPYL